MSILGELQRQNGGAWVELFEVDSTAQGGGVVRFHAGTNGLRNSVVWQGNTYEPFPIQATGFEVSGQQMPRPKLAVANVSGVITALLASSELLGAKVIRRRTMVKYLDDANFPIVQKPTPAVLTFTRSSTATYYGSDGLLKTAAANQPRIDYDPLTLAVRGLLIEEQRTNRFLQSGDFTVSPWAAAVTGTSTRSNVAGTRGFGLGLVTATSNLGGLRQSSTGLTSGQVYSLSFYLESTAASITLAIENGLASYGTACSLVFNPATGSITSQVGFTSVTSTPLDSGRVYSVVLPAAGGSLAANVEWRLPTTGDSFKIGRPQFEAGAFATSYIPTTTAAVTRAADVATAALGSIGFNALEGSVTGEASILASGTSGNKKSIFSLTPGNFNAEIRGVLFNATSLSYTVGDSTLGGTQANLSATVAALSGFTFATAYKENDFGLSANGLAPVTDTLGAVTANINHFNIGCTPQTSSGTSNVKGDYLNGHIKRLRYHPRRLTNAELQTITSGGTVADMPAFELDTSGGSLAVYTLGQYNPSADPNAHLPDEIYYIAQKTQENHAIVEFELGSPIDLQGVTIPRRQIVANLCLWRYRGDGCGYAGGPVADENDIPTSVLANDKCSKRLSGCKLRFGDNNELPYGGFPAAGLVKF